MPFPYWAQEFPEFKTTDLMMVTPTHLVYASRKSVALARAVAALRQGEAVPPPTGSTSIRLSDVRAVDYQVGVGRVWVRDAGGKRHAVLDTASTADAAIVARELAAALRLDARPPAESPAGLWAVTLEPALVAAFLGSFFGLIYFSALHTDSSKPTSGYGKAALFKSIAAAVGPDGILLAGLTLFGLCAVWWARRVVDRPTVYSYGQRP